MADILTDFTNIFNRGGGTDTILWFTVCLLVTAVAVLDGSSILKKISGAGYVCMFVSFFNIGIEYQAFLFAVLVVLIAVCGKNKENKKNE